jgi:outer membrane protein OmpA-like peptidoglycan-associated protein
VPTVLTEPKVIIEAVPATNGSGLLAPRAGVLPVATFFLPEIYFQYNKWHLTPDGKRQVTEYAKLMKRTPSSVILIVGHTDLQGSKRNNKVVGLRRAKTVWRALKKAGVPNSLGIVSYGEERPIDFGKTKTADAKNRRVTIEVKER